jgi:hypothetical protein
MVVLNWSWLRTVISSNCPGASSVRGSSWTVKLARSVEVLNTPSRARFGR